MDCCKLLLFGVPFICAYCASVWYLQSSYRCDRALALFPTLFIEMIDYFQGIEMSLDEDYQNQLRRMVVDRLDEVSVVGLR